MYNFPLHTALLFSRQIAGCGKPSTSCIVKRRKRRCFISNQRHDTWQAVLAEIELSISHGSYVTWFKKTELLDIVEGVALVSVPNIFAKQQFETKFSSLIVDALSHSGTEIQKISYVIGNKIDKSPEPRPSVRMSSTPSSRVVTGSLNPKYTFENYIVGGNNDLAYAACQAASKSPGEKYNPLFIYGGVGLGKTHLIQAVGNEIIKKKPDLRVLYISSETFVNEFLDSIRYKKKGFADKYRSVDVLIVDDMQFIAGKEKTQDEFFHTFNALHQANKQIIISSDKPPKSIPTLTERLRSRFEWGMAIDIQMPDFETRCAIIDAKAAQSGVNLPRETTEFIANTIKTNIRELEGALNHLLATVELRGLEANVQTASALLGDVKKMRPHHVTPKQIVDKTAKHFQIEVKDIVSPKRDKHIVVPRQIAMYLLRSELHMSFPRIAHELGRKDHTTAIHSVEKTEKSIKLDFVVREHVSMIRDALYG